MMTYRETSPESKINAKNNPRKRFRGETAKKNRAYTANDLRHIRSKERDAGVKIAAQLCARTGLSRAW